MLIGLGDLSAAAWRKRLRACHAWVRWRVRERVAVPTMPGSRHTRPRGRIRLIDASALRQPGGTGDDWRWPLADDCTAGRMGPVVVTDDQTGAQLAHDQ